MKTLPLGLLIATTLGSSAHAQNESYGPPSVLNNPVINNGMTVNGSPILINGSTFLPVLAGTTGSIGGGLLTIGCTSGTVSITGATTGMVATATPLTFPGNNIQWQAYISSANTVTVSVCTSLTLTPTASVYYVRVTP